MDAQLFIGLLATILPILDIRAGLPILVSYATNTGNSIWPIFVVVLMLNALMIYGVFMFLDYFHHQWMKQKHYKKYIGRHIEKTQKKAHKLQERMNNWGYLGLVFFVAVPFPGSGSWTGVLVSWILDLDRGKSLLAILLGTFLLGLVIIFLSLKIFA